ncbi:helix-turn-helix domain-containing protein [Microvirga sp. 2MCAF38]|uniref:helix-turn-helix domain-containing protein n=1 Tax=Microvirga sp. 2MCAF38 TaxID=3232989 RepID=UPI003F9B9F41
MTSRASLKSRREEISTSGRVTNRRVPALEQSGVWREFRLDDVEVSSARNDAPGFSVDHLSWDLGGVLLAQTFLPASAERWWWDLPKSFEDHWCLALARGDGRTHSRVRWASGPASFLSFLSLIKSFEEQGAGEEALTLFLPRALFRKEVRALDNTHGVVLDPGHGVILADYLTSLARVLPSISQEYWPGLKAATCAMVAACLAPMVDRMTGDEKPIMAALRERARRIVKQNISSAEFGPEALGRLLFVSRSKLYRVFERSGGVARFIQRERLEEAHRHLFYAKLGMPISRLAGEVGFGDHSAFSRAFKLEYGYSPSELREMALAKHLLETQAPNEGVCDSDSAYGAADDVHYKSEMLR